MPKILMPIGDGTEALDTFYAYYRLPEDGYDVVVAGPEDRLFHTVLHEIPPNPAVPWDITEERPGYHLQADVAFRDLQAEEFAGAFISGGRAPEYIRYDRDLCRVIREIAEAGKPIACLCHGIEENASPPFPNARSTVNRAAPLTLMKMLFSTGCW